MCHQGKRVRHLCWEPVSGGLWVCPGADEIQGPTFVNWSATVHMVTDQQRWGYLDRKFPVHKAAGCAFHTSEHTAISVVCK